MQILFVAHCVYKLSQMFFLLLAFPKNWIVKEFSSILNTGVRR